MLPEQEMYYLSIGGVRCPFCKSDQLSTGSVDDCDDIIFKNIVCDNCKKEWTDEYTLTGVSTAEQS